MDKARYLTLPGHSWSPAMEHPTDLPYEAKPANKRAEGRRNCLKRLELRGSLQLGQAAKNDDQ